jgi:exodeoxyribonuclease V beta subunit
MEIFDPFSADIKGRTTLIEASAGTGKTYTITSLFLRLILEKELLI